jgi:hypothetical protein
MPGLSFSHRILGRRFGRHGPRPRRRGAPRRGFDVVFGDANSGRMGALSPRNLRAVLPLSLVLVATAGAQVDLARASTFASVIPSLRPDRPHARAALTITIHFEGGEDGVPSPLQHAELHLPANVNLDIPELRSCSATVLQARGPAACPARSVIGGGSALVEGELGSQAVTESVSLQAFLGPLRNLQPTFEILAGGYRPVGAQRVLGATASPDRAPYGEALAMSVPPISTVPNEPDASVLTFSLTIGRPRAGRHAAAVIVPARCPRGGFPFEGEFTYADGSSSRVYATAPCPR